jgi:hypothetical protein
MAIHHIASRPAKTGDKLISTHFTTTITRGFADPCESNVPGTDLAFESNIGCVAPNWKSEHKVARFRQVNLYQAAAHHDALEFPDGHIVLVTNLTEGQRATVLQLPNTDHPASKGEAQRHNELQRERSGV